MRRSRLAAAFLAASLVATPCLAWHEVGHILTMLMAYQQLSPGDAPSPVVQRLVAILRHHPRFQEDFARSMPQGLSEDGAARWLLCRASIWSDQVRFGRPKTPLYPPLPAQQGSYNRSAWHFIDTPLVILAYGTSDDQTQALEKNARAHLNLATEVPADEEDVKNILQAIGFNRERFLHGNPAEQAVALCWLLHTLGDIHQPLHASAAFSVRVLEPEHHRQGDGGGNSIRLFDKGSLHALWDDAPDDNPDPVYDKDEPFDQRYDRAYARALKQIEPLLADTAVNAQGKRAAEEKDPQQWARESFELAKEKVYVAEIRKRIIAADQDEKKPPRGVFVRLPDGYGESAHEIGKLRVVQGGYRTAEFLKSILR